MIWINISWWKRWTPKGRYLPDLEIVPKTSQFRDSQQTILAQQIDIAWNWSYKVIETLDLTPVKGELAGSMSLGELHRALGTTWPSNQPIHLILPVQDQYNATQSFDVYRTPGATTLLLMPVGNCQPGERFF